METACTSLEILPTRAFYQTIIAFHVFHSHLSVSLKQRYFNPDAENAARRTIPTRDQYSQQRHVPVRLVLFLRTVQKHPLHLLGMAWTWADCPNHHRHIIETREWRHFVSIPSHKTTIHNYHLTNTSTRTNPRTTQLLRHHRHQLRLLVSHFRPKQHIPPQRTFPPSERFLNSHSPDSRSQNILRHAERRTQLLLPIRKRPHPLRAPRYPQPTPPALRGR